MLVLTRYPNQSIVIDEGDIRIVVLGIEGEKVRIGIDAPEEVLIEREEIYWRRRKDTENETD